MFRLEKYTERHNLSSRRQNTDCILTNISAAVDSLLFAVVVRNRDEVYLRVFGHSTIRTWTLQHVIFNDLFIAFELWSMDAFKVNEWNANALTSISFLWKVFLNDWFFISILIYGIFILRMKMLEFSFPICIYKWNQNTSHFQINLFLIWFFI